ncbi:hypothetical protein BTHE68_36640 [Burkholderia sp. THE68]|nr:hypothetical protein BTHE68_36640 [Burkholderia sp. THE68]
MASSRGGSFPVRTKPGREFVSRDSSGVTPGHHAAIYRKHGARDPRGLRCEKQDRFGDVAGLAIAPERMKRVEGAD